MAAAAGITSVPHVYPGIVLQCAASFGFGRLAAVIGRRGCMFIATVLHLLFYVLVLILHTNSVFDTLRPKTLSTETRSAAAYVTA